MKLALWMTAAASLLIAPSAFAVMGFADLPAYVCAKQMVETDLAVPVGLSLFKELYNEYSLQRLDDHMQLEFQAQMMMQKRNYYMYGHQADASEEGREISREPRLANRKHLSLTLIPSFDRQTDVVRCRAVISGDLVPTAAPRDRTETMQLNAISDQDTLFVQQRLEMVCGYAMDDVLEPIPSLGQNPCGN